MRTDERTQERFMFGTSNQTIRRNPVITNTNTLTAKWLLVYTYPGLMVMQIPYTIQNHWNHIQILVDILFLNAQNIWQSYKLFKYCSLVITAVFTIIYVGL